MKLALPWEQLLFLTMTMSSKPVDIKNLHHAAYRCRDSEETRKFYEDFLELPLVETLPITSTKTGRVTKVLHTFYQMKDGACVAFFEACDMPFEFKQQHDFDLHIALEVDKETLLRFKKKGEDLGMDVRGIADHRNIESIYFRDPNGYVLELTAPIPGTGFQMEKARGILDKWTKDKAEAAAADEPSNKKQKTNGVEETEE
jgi:catechol 2,3-dioxygenase-like lactoylglutathione lyase family enzyme